MLNAFNSLIHDIDTNLLFGKSLLEFLNEYFPTERKNKNNKQKLLIFDQLEELFTFYPNDNWREQQEDFFEQIAEALENDPSLRIVFVIREDYLAELDPFVDILPERLRSRFRLERLSKEAAYLAIKKPLEKIKTNVDKRLVQNFFNNEMIEKIIDELTKIKKEQFGGSFCSLKGEFIESIHLQVVCQRLWQKLQSTKITEFNNQNYFDSLIKFDKILEDFYDEVIDEAAVHGKINQDTLRNWIETSLITSSGIRGKAYRDSKTSDGISNEAIQILIQKHLIHSQNCIGGHWYELIHDQFIEPIKSSNAKRKVHDSLKLINKRQIEKISRLGIGKIININIDSKQEKKFPKEIKEDIESLSEVEEKLSNIREIKLQQPQSFDIEESLKYANFLFYSGKYEQAIPYLNRVIEIDSSNVDAWSNKGLISIDLKKYDEAIKYYDKALEIDSTYIDAWKGKGNVFLHLKKYHDSLQYFTKAHEFNPEEIVNKINYAQSLLLTNNYEKSVKILKELYDQFDIYSDYGFILRYLTLCSLFSRNLNNEAITLSLELIEYFQNRNIKDKISWSFSSLRNMLKESSNLNSYTKKLLLSFIYIYETKTKRECTEYIIRIKNLINNNLVNKEKIKNK
ncbi:MAG TPA: tetratricopeptide repeat protein [Nitrososphaeraceae archaeon]|nr:tetratricopeptide repeat protein [Nitrososphaeraceae archaeon]